jgi:hypothetical protein
MQVYDNYEISPCARTEEPDKPGHFYFKVCDPPDADAWTLYGHIHGEGVEAIGDFSSRQHAELVYSRITGQPFTGSYQADARLRVMHAGPQLLEALTFFFNIMHDYRCSVEKGYVQLAMQKSKTAIEQATGRAA